MSLNTLQLFFLLLLLHYENEKSNLNKGVFLFDIFGLTAEKLEIE